MKRSKMVVPKVQSQPCSDASRALWERHVAAVQSISQSINHMGETVVRSLAKIDNVDVTDGWRFNADTLRWEKQS